MGGVIVRCGGSGDRSKGPHDRFGVTEEEIPVVRRAVDAVGRRGVGVGRGSGAEQSRAQAE